MSLLASQHYRESLPLGSVYLNHCLHFSGSSVIIFERQHGLTLDFYHSFVIINLLSLLRLPILRSHRQLSRTIISLLPFLKFSQKSVFVFIFYMFANLSVCKLISLTSWFTYSHLVWPFPTSLPSPPWSKLAHSVPATLTSFCFM